MAGLVDRMIRAAKLEPALYEEVEADASATGEAMTVVFLSSLAAGVGGWGSNGMTGAALGIGGALIGWFVWAFLTFFLGTKLLPGPSTHANLGELLRTIGYASSPGVLRALGGVPTLGPLANAVAALWMLAAFVVAVRQALDYPTTGRAILVCVIGWLVYLGLSVGLMALLIALGMGAVLGVAGAS
jgi:hypothetical protein